MQKFSSKNTYGTSNGERYTKQQINTFIQKAKKIKYQEFINQHGYIFCEVCERNDCTPIDISHLVSVKEAQELGQSELAWDVKNLEFHGRKCHNKHETKSHSERMNNYKNKL